MKKIQILVAATIFFVIEETPVFAKKSPQIQIEKTVHSQYVIQDNCQLVIDNCYGQVHINTWDKNEVTIDIVVTAKAKSITNAQQILDNINFKTESNKDGNHKILYKTVIERPNRIKNGEMTIDYTINTPRNNGVDITNKYGNSYLRNVSQSASVNTLETGLCDISYSNISINKRDNIEGNNKCGQANRNINLLPAKVNEFDKVQVSVANKQIMFISLPAEKRTIWAYLTSIYGEIIMKKKISRNKNYINAGKLPRGTYFVTLVYEGHNRKGSMIDL